ncbi:hypothetical protein [Kocuria massiliensis]|uniref:hypothetical protein n=1 Tax=Kocuria massiliensis TaxID=1926282 RepID=UPI00117AD907|nr:hypothetical protein [Kocuria massiliensis]
MKKLISSTLTTLLAISFSLTGASPAQAQRGPKNGLSTQKVKDALSTIPPDKLLEPKESQPNPTFSLMQDEIPKQIEINGPSISIGTFDISLPNSSEMQMGSTDNNHRKL